MRHRMLAPINSIKHYVQAENTTTATGVRRSVELVTAVSQSAAGASTNEVLEGSIVKAIFIEFWIQSQATSGNDVKFQFVLEKLPGAESTFITFTEMNNLMAYTNKKNIFFVSQGVFGDNTTQAVPIVRQWFKIPKGKQRFGLGDRIHVAISATGATINTCGISTYKEYK